MTATMATEDRVSREARAWVVRMSDPAVGEAEHSAFAAWIAADVSHGGAYQRALRLYQAAETLRGAFADTPRTPEASWTRRRLPWIGAAGAALAAALLLFVLMPPSTMAPISPDFQTALGEVRTIELDDGSEVTLGAATSMELAFTPEERRVRIGPGEAYFDVRHDPSRPFVVESAEGEVRVLGTAFDVKTSDGLMRVAVARGLVQVDQHPSNRLPAASPGHRVSAGEEIVLGGASARDAVVTATTHAPAAWREGFLAYQSAHLGEVVADANRYSSRPIRLSDPALAQLEVTAFYPSDQLEQMLNGLEDALPISVERHEREIIIRPAR